MTATLRTWFILFLRLEGWWLLTSLGLSIAAGGVGWYQYHQAIRYDRDGIIVPVAVADLWSWRLNGKGGSQTYYYGSFTYAVDGQNYAFEKQISSDEHARFQIGNVEQMRVLRDDPTELETTFGETETTAHVALWIALGIGVVSLGIAGIVFSNLSLAIQSGKQGILVRAEVTEHIGSIFDNGQIRWRLPDGQSGRSLTNKMDRLRHFPVGSTIEVFTFKGHSFWAEDIGHPAERATSVPAVPRP